MSEILNDGEKLTGPGAWKKREHDLALMAAAENLKVQGRSANRAIRRQADRLRMSVSDYAVLSRIGKVEAGQRRIDPDKRNLILKPLIEARARAAAAEAQKKAAIEERRKNTIASAVLKVTPEKPDGDLLKPGGGA